MPSNPDTLRIITAPHRARLGATLPAAAVVWLALAATARVAVAQQPQADTSVGALVQALSGGPQTRAFRRTSLPDAGSSLCAGQEAAAPAAATRGLRSTRNLEVVPYAGDTAPGVNLSVQFALSSDKLTAPDLDLLGRLATALQSPELAQQRFAIAGHTDTSGDARTNLELSCARALAVRRFLSANGVAEYRLSAYGFGSTRLLPDSGPGDGVQRRVEVRKAPQ